MLLRDTTVFEMTDWPNRVKCGGLTKNQAHSGAATDGRSLNDMGASLPFAEGNARESIHVIPRINARILVWIDPVLTRRRKSMSYGVGKDKANGCIGALGHEKI